MKVGLASWCIYVPRYRKLINGSYIPVPGPDEDAITLSYEACNVLKLNGFCSSVKSLVTLSEGQFNGLKSALLASLLRLNGVRTYDANDVYHLVNLIMSLVTYGDVLVNVTSVNAAASVSMIVSSSASSVVSIEFFDMLVNAVPLASNGDVRNEFYSELYLNTFSRFLSGVFRKASINPKDVKYVATNLKDLRYCSKVLKNVGVSEKALEPTKFVSNYAYFNSMHSLVSLIRALELASSGDYILYLDVDKNYSYIITLVFRANEDLSKLRGCVLPLENLLNTSSSIII